jgi:serine/threonine-protein kinase
VSWRPSLPQAERPRRIVTHLLIAISGFALAWILVAFVIFPDNGPVDTVTVPVVLGLRYEEAQAKLAEAGLDASRGEARVSASAPRSTVIAQTPTPGTRVSRGVSVTLDISAGQRSARIPRLEGLSRDRAEAALREQGLTVGQVLEQVAGEARGTVLSAQPEPGTVVPEGTAVALVVSAGPAELALPDIVGRELIEARAMLEQLGLVVGTTEFDSTSQLPRGLIIAQSPAAGSSVLPGATITLRVSGRP